AFDEGLTGAIEQLHLARDARLRSQEQCFDVSAHRIQVLALVHEIAVGARQHFLDALLTAGHDELFELAMRVDQRFGGRRFECNPAFGADDRVAQMNASTDSELRADRFELLDESEEHTSELQSRENLVCRLLLEKKNNTMIIS